MTEKKIKQITNIIIVSEQLEQVDIIEKSLKGAFTINTYVSNNIIEIKKILSRETIDLIIVDDADSTIGVGAVSSALKELKQKTPILQLESQESKIAGGEFIKNGASVVCLNKDQLAIRHNTQLLLDYSQGQQILAKDSQTIDDYQEKFNDLYLGLADPVCYLHDGVFIDCNPAFLRAFEVSDKDELDELTILNFIDRRHQSDLKAHLRKSKRRDLSANPVLFNLQTKLGKPVEFTIMSKPSTFDDEEAVQVYMRSTSEGGVGTSLYDASTGLANREQMGFYLEQKLQQFAQNGGQGFLVYLFVANYRDIWCLEGFEEAEKLITAVVKQIRETLSSHTEASRYTDDGLVIYMPGEDAKAIDKTITQLIKALDKLTPEGMSRMVEPLCYAGYDGFTQGSDHVKTIASLFRVSRNAALSQGARVSQPTTNEVAKKDARRIEALQEVLKNETMELLFQPIASFEPDGTERYRERIRLTHGGEDGEVLELDLAVAVAERYQLMHKIDQWKMNQLFNLLLAMPIESREHLRIYIALSADSLRNANFAGWLTEQMQHTGLGGKHFVFEMSADDVINAYTGAVNLSQAVRRSGAGVAITKIGLLNTDNERIINEIRPEVIKLDLREIDTLDENEEAEVMGDLCAKASEIDALMIAEYLESPAQLSRIWPYDIKFIQGDGMTPILPAMDFNFDEFAI